MKPIAGLLKQMERHYKQHTENVKKKMELANWPKKQVISELCTKPQQP